MLHIRFPTPAVAIRNADILVVCIAASLPWSTSLPAIFVGLWLVALIPLIDRSRLLQSLKHPACLLPIAFFALALIGTLWSDVPWSTRLYYVGPAAKLLIIPLLIFHFQRSPRGPWIFSAFLISCTLLMIMSWIVAIEPWLALRPDATYGVPVKNYIDQSQEFSLCAIALAYPAVHLFRRKRYSKALILAAVTAGFIANMVFVTVSRTALVTMPAMLCIFALLHLSARKILVLASTSLVLATIAWFTSSNLQTRVERTLSEFQSYETSNQATSVGLRLEFWRKSLEFFKETPILGHGTGSIRTLFAQSAVGKTGASGEIIANPHNQTLYTAVQWGSLGVIVLYAMWICHLLLFRGSSLAHWIGLLVVSQNIMTSLFNSHLFDFHEGWMYVLGVGVAGGMVLSSKPSDRHQQGACRAHDLA